MTKEQIRVLSNREQARERINVWHGSSNNWINMIKELIGNSLDVFKKNESINNEIQIIIHDKNKIEFIDNATGIPVDGLASNGDPNYVAVFETPFAGSNYDNLSDTVGQNGIFLWTLSMTCKNIEYFISRNNKNVYNISYHKGERTKELSVTGKSEKTYSRLIFELDEDIWETPNFTFDAVSEIAKVQSSRGNVKIIVKDAKTNKENIFYYEGGLEEYFNKLTESKSKVTENIFIKTSKEMNMTAKGRNVIERFSTNLILFYSNDNSEDIKKEFLNTADLIQYGTIQEGMILGLKNSVHKWLKDNNKYQKNEKNITNEDIFMGLNYVSDNTSLYVEYENQIKQKTSTKRYVNLMKSIIEEFMEIFFIENNVQAELMCNQVLINKRAREKSNNIRANIKKKLESEISIINKIPNLIPCKSKDVTKNILCLSEGKSSTSGLMDGRRDIHALYPLRGKVLNCLKASYEQIFCNEVILGVMRSLGCGIEIKSKHNKELNTFDINKLKYSKVFIIVDADIDGIGSILPLLITMFYVLTPTLIKEGRIFLCETPKYEVLCEDKYYYAINDAELENVKNELQNKKYKVFYVKGLAELNSETMAMCLAEGYQNITQITMERAEESIKSLELFMGDLVKPRQEYILENF